MMSTVPRPLLLSARPLAPLLDAGAAHTRTGAVPDFSARLAVGATLGRGTTIQGSLAFSARILSDLLVKVICIRTPPTTQSLSWIYLA